MMTATAQTAEIEHLARRFEATKPETILEWAVERFRPKLAMTSTFGAAGIVLIDKLAHRTPDADPLPRYRLHFAETEKLKEQVRERYRVTCGSLKLKLIFELT